MPNPNFYTEVIHKSVKFNSPLQCKDLGLLEPQTREAIVALIHEASQQGMKLQVGETYRSVERQKELFEKKLTQLQNVGVHHYGLACDLELIDYGEHYDPVGEDYLFLRTLAEKHGLISGIDWGHPEVGHSFRDWDHVQRVAVERQESLFAGNWYPEDSYHPLVDLGRSRISLPGDALVK